jgi:hypothetical protein
MIYIKYLILLKKDKIWDFLWPFYCLIVAIEIMFIMLKLLDKIGDK